MSTKQIQQRVMDMPEGVIASLEGRTLSVKGKLGEAKKHFDKVSVNISVEGNKVLVSPFSHKKKDNVIINTVASLIDNMVTGVTKGYTYRLKVVYAHFPISVKTKGSQILVENFVGERSPRVAEVVGNCKVSVEGDDIIVKGVSVEDVGQTSANVELATKIRKKDQRVFLDGVSLYHKEEGWYTMPKAKVSEENKLKALVAKRKEIAEGRPKFIRQESWRYVRLHPEWRKPKGVDNKVRRQDKGWPALVRVGYRGPVESRGLHPSGHFEVLVHRVGDLEGLVPGRDVARIGGTVGARKRQAILERATELGIRVVNPTGLRIVESKE
jgi:large subunit ribosomal protein L6